MCVTISGLCRLTKTADKWTSVQSTVVNKDVFVVILVLYNSQSIRFARLEMICQRLANQSRVKCVYNTSLELVWPKPSCTAQWKGEEDKADRGRGGKTTSENGQAVSSPSRRGQWRTGENGGNWLWNHLWSPNDPRGRGIDDDDDENMTGQSDMLGFYGTGNITLCLGHRRLSRTKQRRPSFT